MVRNWRMLLADTLTIGTALIYPTKEVLAQNITTDGTVGTPQTLTGPNYEIPPSLGQTVNNNLFHSFGQFNLNSNEAAIFQSGNDINNIFSRVTGGSPSSINGLIQTLGQNVNLFFLNPSGIIFGPNASLDVSGSFLATTADSFVFGDGLEFSATNPQSAPLLTVNFTPGLQYGQNNPSRTIENQGNLTVGSQQRLTLAGNQVTSTGSLTAPGGRVELLGTESVALLENATIDVSSSRGGGTVLIGGNFQGKGTLPNAQRTYVGNNVTINADALTNGNGGRVIVWADEVTGFYGKISARGGVELGNGGLVEVSGKEHLIFRGNVDTSAVNGVPGTLLLDPTNIIIADGSGDEAGDGTDTFAGNNSGVEGSILSAPLREIEDTEPTTIYESELEGLSGDTNIILQATNDITLQDLSDDGLELAAGAGIIALSADADRDGVGDFIMEDNLADTIFTNGRDIGISGASLAIGNIDTSQQLVNSGSVALNASGDVNINGVVDTSGNLGNGGAVDIKARSLFLTNGADISSGINRQGNGGAITINAKEAITMSGESSQGFPSRIFSQVESEAVGNSGNINIYTSSLSLNDGAQLSANTLGVGDGGSVNIIAAEKVLFDGIGEKLLSPGGAFSRVETGARGKGGSISITTNSLEVINGAILSASTRGEGNAGTVNIQAEYIVFDGEDSDGFGSGAFSQVGSRGIGNAGGISITTRTLQVTNGAELAVSTLGEGNAGNLTIIATEKVLFDGETKSGFLNSGAFSRVDSDARGNGGNILISTGVLKVTNGTQLDASTDGEGNAGTVTVEARDSVVFDGVGSRFLSGASTTTRGTGKAGNLTISTRNLLVKNGAQVQTTTFGPGKAGNLTVNATESAQLAGFFETPNGRFFPSGLFASTQGLGDAGDLIIATKVLLVKDGAEVQSSSNFGFGDGGKLTVNATESVQLIGSADNGRLGGLFTKTRGTGKAGNIKIVTGQLLVRDGSNVSAVTVDDDSGNITVTADNLEITSGGQLRTTTTGIAKAGNINLFVPDRIILSGSDSGLFAQTEGAGNAGNITINTPQLTIDQGASISAFTEAAGDGGTIRIIAPETINISGQGKIEVETTGSGNAGSINITSQNFNLSNQTEISASTFSSGKAGDINITANNFNLRQGATVITNTDSSGQAGDIQLNIRDNLNLFNSKISASTTSNSTGRGGNITIDPKSVTIQDGATIAVNSDGDGQGGSIELTAENLTLNNGSITAETASSKGGNITLNVGDTLSFENSGQITASAGTEQAGGDGGNVTINADFILAFPTDNKYQIIANAFEGNGGNIEITTNSFFGREFVDISASSNQGLEGNVSINILEVNPARGLTKLPTDVIDASQQITQGCTPQESGRFVATGRGGLPLSPNEPLRGTAVITNWVDEPTETISRVNNQSPTKLTNESSAEIVEAQAWMINDRGNVELVAEPRANSAMPINIPCNSY